jgi:penicillin-binding protein 1A
VRVLPPQVDSDIVMMMNSVVENGTGRRAQLDGIKAAGKTGTTNSFRDAWFMGYTGNFVCGVWFGNDDYTSTRNLTGGSLPAMTWHKVMAYAHQGVEIKPLPGLKGQPAPKLEEPRVAAASNFSETPRPVTLSPRTSDRLLRLEKDLRESGSSRSSTILEPYGRAVAAGEGKSPSPQ